MTDKPPQRPYDQALQKGLVALKSRLPTPEKLRALGVTMAAGRIWIPSLNRHLVVDLDQKRVLVDDSEPARPTWAVLAVHYACADAVAPDPRAVSFSYFKDCHNYLDVFGKRITARFLATSGRSSEQFSRLGEQFGGTRVPGSGTGYRFTLFPRVPITIVRYEGDSEVSAGASIIYQADIEHLLPAEDRVVAAELLLDILAGKPMTEREV